LGFQLVGSRPALLRERLVELANDENMRRHYGANVVARCRKDGQFMACSFRRGAGCAQLGVANGDNGAEPIVIIGVLPAPRSSCT
jgi:hypothetical protein